jgi:hypothetical protein
MTQPGAGVVDTEAMTYQARHRTLTLPPDLATFAAMVVLPGSAEVAAHVRRFPGLTLKAPLELDVDDRGWYRAVFHHPRTGERHVGYLRAEWAADRLRRSGGWRAVVERVRAWWWTYSAGEAELRLLWMAHRSG